MTVIGARPQFIKAATVSRVIREYYSNDIEEIVVHTGQHYDSNMSQIFFNELNIPLPICNLNIGSGSHSEQSGAIMVGLESLIKDHNPDWVLVYGDTNSTLAGALVAAKVPCKLAHVEAGLRSYRWGMPEEVNRIVTDRLSDVLFCPTINAKNNLISEGRSQYVVVVGDVMYDSFLYYKKSADQFVVLNNVGLLSGKYLLATIHRAENTDIPEKLIAIFSILRSISKNIEVVLPLHPRTKKAINQLSISLEGIRVIDPVSYLTMIVLVCNSKLIITDSGGLQKEAYFARRPCITFRDETEWSETLDSGWNQLVSLDNESDILEKIKKILDINTADLEYSYCYGSGDSAKKIVDYLIEIS